MSALSFTQGEASHTRGVCVTYEYAQGEEGKTAHTPSGRKFAFRLQQADVASAAKRLMMPIQAQWGKVNPF